MSRAALALMCLLPVAAFADDARADVRAALEEQLPVPARPLALPAPAAKPQAPGPKAKEEGRLNGKALGKEDHDATGQARAAEVRKNVKKPHPPKP